MKHCGSIPYGHQTTIQPQHSHLQRVAEELRDLPTIAGGKPVNQRSIKLTRVCIRQDRIAGLSVDEGRAVPEAEGGDERGQDQAIRAPCQMTAHGVNRFAAQLED